MLAFKYRFHGYGSLRYVYKNGSAQRSRLMTTKSVENRRRQSSRFAVVVSRKVLKRAVYRNRVRRRIYEIIRRELPHFTNVHDVSVIAVSGELLTIPHQELEEILKELFVQAGLYN